MWTGGRFDHREGRGDEIVPARKNRRKFFDNQEVRHFSGIYPSRVSELQQGQRFRSTFCQEEGLGMGRTDAPLAE